MRELAFLNKGLKLNLKIKSKKKNEEFKYDSGVLEFVEFL